MWWEGVRKILLVRDPGRVLVNLTQEFFAVWSVTTDWFIEWVCHEAPYDMWSLLSWERERERVDLSHFLTWLRRRDPGRVLVYLTQEFFTVWSVTTDWFIEWVCHEAPYDMWSLLSSVREIERERERQRERERVDLSHFLTWLRRRKWNLILL